MQPTARRPLDARGGPPREGGARVSREGQYSRALWIASEPGVGDRVDRVDRVWVGDITYLRVVDGWRYLAIVMDRYSRRILAWTLTRRTFVAARGVQQSVSVRGPEDNAHAESFFHSLKAELTRGAPVGTEPQLRQGLNEYIRYYNTRRLHSALGYQSPVAFAREAA